MPSPAGMSRQIDSHQRLETRIVCEIDENSGTPQLVTGGEHVTITDNGTGDYTLTLNVGAARTLQAIAQTYTADTVIQIGTRSKTAVQVLCFDATDGTTAKEADCVVEIVAWYSADET